MQACTPFIERKWATILSRPSPTSASACSCSERFFFNFFLIGRYSAILPDGNAEHGVGTPPQFDIPGRSCALFWVCFRLSFSSLPRF